MLFKRLSISTKGLIFFVFVELFSIDIYAADITNLVNPVYYFIGRKENLSQINDFFRKGEKIVSIVGVSGIGKTELSRKYAETNVKNYRVIWYFNMSSNMELQYQEFARAINKLSDKSSNIVTEDISLVAESLESYLNAQKNCLLIFDNLDSEHNDIYKNFILKEHNFDVLVISQNSLGLKNKVLVEELNEQESLEVIEKISDPLSEEMKEIIIKKTKGFPLLLVQSLYLSKDSKFITQKILDNEHDNILSKITMDLIKHLSKEQLADLVRVSLLDASNLDKNLLYKIILNKDNLYYFSNLNIIRENHSVTSNQKTDYMSMNELIKNKILELSENELVSQQLLKILDEINELLVSYQSDNPGDIINDYPNILTHLENLLKEAEEKKISKYKLLELRKNMESIYFPLLNYKKTLEMINWFNEHKSQFNFKAMNNLQKEAYIGFFIESAQYKLHIEDKKTEAMSLFKEAISYINKTNINKIKFYALVQYAQAQICIGNLKKSIIYINNAKELLNSNKDLHINYQGDFVFTDSLIKLEMGKYDDALALLKNYIVTNALKHNPDSEPIYELKSQILLRKGNFEEAYNNAIESLNRTKNYFKGYKHDLEIRGLIFLAWAEAGVGKIQEAKEHIGEARKYFFQEKANEDRKGGVFLAYIPFVEGFIYESENSYKKAIKAYEEANHNIKLIYYDELENDFYGMLLEKLALVSRKAGDNFRYGHYVVKHEKIFGVGNERSLRIDRL